MSFSTSDSEMHRRSSRKIPSPWSRIALKLAPKCQLTLLSTIQRASLGIENRFKDQPLVEASVRLTIGRAFRLLGEVNHAENHLMAASVLFETQSGRRDGKTMEALQELAWLFLEQSQSEKAFGLCQEILPFRTKTLGADHEQTLETKNCLGQILNQGFRHEEAAELFSTTLEQALQAKPPRHNAMIQAMSGLAITSFYLGLTSERSALTQEAYRASRDHLGPDHPSTLFLGVQMVNALGNFDKDFEVALPIAEETLARCDRVLGREHPTTLRLLSEMASLRYSRGLDGLRGYRGVDTLCQKALGPDHSLTLFNQMRLGVVLQTRGFPAESERLLTNATHRLNARHGETSWLSRLATSWLAGVYMQQERYAEAEALYRHLLTLYRSVMSEELDIRRNQAFRLANFYARQGRWSEAASIYHEELPRLKHATGQMPNGILADWLSEDHDEMDAVDSWAAKYVNDTTPSRSAYRGALVLMLLLPELPASQDILGFAERVAGDLTNPLHKDLLGGLLAFRRQSWSEMENRLLPMSKNPDGSLASLSSSVLAMGKHLQESHAEAQKHLNYANARLAGLVRSGDLGNNVRSPGAEWTQIGIAILARDMAEQLMHGHRVSASIDAPYLAQQRELWKRVAELIEQAHWAGRERNWTRARSLYINLLQHPQFDFDSAGRQLHSHAYKMLAAFAASGDKNNYDRVFNERFQHTVPGQTFPHSKPDISYLPWLHSPEMTQQAIARAKQRLIIAERSGESNKDRARYQLILGIALYRSGDFNAALAAFTKAQEDYNLNFLGMTRAFLAMTKWQLGHRREAMEHLQSAESMLQQVLDDHGNDLRQTWDRTATLEVVLKEARELID